MKNPLFKMTNLYCQVVESEKTAKWQYTRHCEDLSVEIKKLREEVKGRRRILNIYLHFYRSESDGV